MASKVKTVYVCQSCGSKFPKWLGKCTGCGEWETIVEEVETPQSRRGEAQFSEDRPPVPLSQVKKEEEARFLTSSTEFDHILGGGIVPGSLILVGGDPGIGKSTLLLQISCSLAKSGKTVLYVSGEESLTQIKLRAERLGADNDKLLVVAENDLAKITHYIEKLKPAIAVIDSIQTVYHPDLPSAQGSVGQVRECASRLMRAAKTLNIAIFLIGHVTREGTIAGPKVLEHIVDTVLYFEGDRNNVHRILRVIKNRFGATNEIAIFEMKAGGLAQVLNPSEFFLAERRDRTVGSIVSCAMEGTRPLLVEIQALASKMNFNYPQRTCSGVDPKRLSLIAAVLERIADYPLSMHDIYLNVTGGFAVDDPAMDLPVACAILSSFLNKPVDKKVCAMGEIGLSGEVRSVSFLETRLKEAQKMGFNRILLSANNAKKIQANPTVEIVGIRDVNELVKNLF
jgi:DNA repair protein RadA/Sms